MRLPLRSGASARVGPIGILRATALPIIAQSFVAVRSIKAGAQRILCYCRHQACYVLRPAPHVGRTGKLRISG